MIISPSAKTNPLPVKSKVGEIKYAIADMGNAIKKALAISEISYVEDLADSYIPSATNPKS